MNPANYSNNPTNNSTSSSLPSRNHRESGHTFNDDSLLDADDDNDIFELRNENYNLKIQINDLEYNHSKQVMELELRIKELRHKNAQLEKQTDKNNGARESTGNNGLTKESATGKESSDLPLMDKVQYLVEEN